MFKLNFVPPLRLSNKITFRVAILAIFCLAIFLRFYRITHQSFWYDEGLSLMRSDGTTLSQVFEALGETPFDKYQPTYFIGLFFWRRLFGDSELVIRAFSVILGLGSMALMTLTALKLFGQRHALWTSGLIAVSAYHVYYSQEARPYSLIMLFAALQLFLFSPLLIVGEKHNRSQFVGFWVVTTLGFLSSIFLFIFTLSLCCAHWLSVRSFKPWFRFWTPLLICVLPGLAFYSTSPYIFDIGNNLKKYATPSLFQNLAFVGSGLMSGVTYLAPNEQLRDGSRMQVIVEYWPHLTLMMGVSAILGLATLKCITEKRVHDSSRNYTPLFLVFLIFISVLLFLCFAATTGMSWLPRHAAFIYLVIALLIPSAFCQPLCSSLIDRKLRKITLAAAVLLLLINGFSLKKYYFNHEHVRDDYRAVAAYVNQHADTDTRSILLWGNARLLKYYGDQHTVSNWNTRGDNLLEEVNLIAGDAQNLIILINRESSTMRYSLEEAMQDVYQLEDTLTYPGFSIYRFHLP